MSVAQTMAVAANSTRPKRNALKSKIELRFVKATVSTAAENRMLDWRRNVMRENPASVLVFGEHHASMRVSQEQARINRLNARRQSAGKSRRTFSKGSGNHAA